MRSGEAVLKPGLRRIAWFVAALLALPVFVEGAALAYLKVQETKLVFLAEHSRHTQGFEGEMPAGVARVGIPGLAGGVLQGFTIAPHAEGGYWVLHLHGNEISAFSRGQVQNVQRIAAQGFNVLAFDYRGFGPTPGEPSEIGLYEDAEAAWQWLRSRGVPAGRIIIWGHSLGSGPATELATLHPAAALVLFGAFTSIADRAAELYPWLPVRWVVGIRFDNLQRIAHIEPPVVFAHSVGDLTIPYAHSQRLYAAAPEPRRLLRLTMQRDDGLGGHVTALYEQMELLMPVLAGLDIAPPAVE
jgi:fermentation-respiration switch protein FrsA (DUF1100 family)